MMTVHEENHLGVECRKLSKTDRNSGIFRTLEEFKDDIFHSFYCSNDCASYWACMHGDDAYKGGLVAFKEDYDTEEVEWINKPDWATHVYWYSK